MRPNLCVIAALLPAGALAQTSFIEGKVVDAWGPLEGAVVTAAGESLQGERSARTGDGGAFFLPQLPPGAYALNVSAPMHAAVTQENVVLPAGSALRLRIELRRDFEAGAAVGSPAQVPVVPAPLVESGGAVTREQAALIPYGLESMGFEESLASLPAVLAAPRSVGSLQALANTTRYRIDGLDVTEKGMLATGLPQQFVEQVALRRGVYSAESGRSSFAAVDAVTRSGGNQLHGSLFGFLVPVEAARSPPAAPVDYAAQTGFELGGPVQRDKLWFYAGLAPEVQKAANSGATTAWQYLGKLTMRPGDDQSLALSIFGDPQAGKSEPGNLAVQYHGKVSEIFLDSVSGVRFLPGDARYEGALSAGTLAQAAGHHFVKAGGDLSRNSRGDGLYAAFAQDRWAVLDLFVVDAGLRYEGQDFLGQQRAELLPRLGASWDFTGRGLSRLHAGVGRFFLPAQGAMAALVDTIFSAGAQLQFYRDAVASADYTHTGASDVVTLSAGKPLSQNYLLQASCAFGSSPQQPGAAVLAKLEAGYLYEWSAKTTATLGTALRIANRGSGAVALDARAALRHALTPTYLFALHVDLLNAFNDQPAAFASPRGLRVGASVSF